MKTLVHSPHRLECQIVNHRRYYKAPCCVPGCPNQRWLQASDLDHVMCQNCQRLHVAYRNIERWRENPTAPEQAMMAILDNAGLVNYTFQHIHFYQKHGRLRWFVFDFWLASGAAIEVNGWWHSTDKGRERDQRLREYCTEYGIALLFIPTERLANDAQSILGDIWLL